MHLCYKQNRVCSGNEAPWQQKLATADWSLWLNAWKIIPDVWIDIIKWTDKTIFPLICPNFIVIFFEQANILVKKEEGREGRIGEDEGKYVEGRGTFLTENTT